MIEQSYYTADIFLTNTYYNYYQLFANDTDRDITNALYAKELDQFAIANVHKKLAQYVKTSPLVQSIYIYNSKADKMIYMIADEYVGVQTPNEFFDKDIMNMIASEDRSKINTYFTRKAEYVLYDKRLSNDLITLIFSNATSENANGSAIIVNLKQSILQQIVSSGKTGDLNQVFIIYQNGDVITHSDSSLINKNLGNENYIKTILQSENKRGYFTSKINGKNSLVTYAKADRLRWIFVGIGEYNKLLASVNSMQRIILVLTIIFIFMGVIVAAFFTSSIYKPFLRLLKDIQKRINNHGKDTSLDVYDYLRYTIHELADDVDKYKMNSNRMLNEKKMSILQKIIDGDIDEEILNTKYRVECGINFDYAFFQVVVLKIDSYTNIVLERWLNDGYLLKFAVVNIACELLGSEQIQVEGIDNGGDFISIIINVSSRDDITFSRITETMKKIQDNVQMYLRCTVTIGVGDIREGVENVHDSFENAISASNYRIVLGQNSIINYNDIEERNKNNHEYPLVLEKQVIDSLKSLNMKKIDVILEEFFDSLIFYSADEILMYVIQFLVALTKAISGIVKAKPGNEEYSFKLLFLEIQKYETLGEIKVYLHTLCSNVIETKSSEPEKTRKIAVVAKIKEYVNRNYNDSNINTDAIADYVELSYNYVRLIFKEIDGISLSDYITQCRMTEAKRLLSQTDYPVRKVAELTGFPENNKHFYTIFKKNFGKTPEDYRNELKALNDR
jgi:AraC-like DNA-binding protein